MIRGFLRSAGTKWALGWGSWPPSLPAIVRITMTVEILTAEDPAS